MRPIKTVLVANRAAVAQRIIRSVQTMGLRAAVVYSDADAHTPAITMADLAVPIGDACPQSSYHNIDAILRAAEVAHADAVHPGYGFLAESAPFARAVRAQELVFIGPSPDTIELLSCKLRTRAFLQETGIPVVPGETTPVHSLDQLVSTALRIGFPLVVKASNGAGGRGLRVVYRMAELPAAYERVRSATRHLDQATIGVERYIESPHHITVPILADAYGNLICLGDRESILQRRHQTIIEEAPSPFLSPHTRRRLASLASRIARMINYTNLGSIEFMVDGHHRCYLLEINPCLDLNHSATEMVTGIDLVQQQIRMARGEMLEYHQTEMVPDGSAIVCSICAEDPDNGFTPSPGYIMHHRQPTRTGVVVASSVTAGSTVTMHYDPHIANVTAWGIDRRQGLQRMKQALQEYRITGIATSIPYCLKAVCGHLRPVNTDPELISLSAGG